jgi:predicted AAA+ superfamily ATPase
VLEDKLRRLSARFYNTGLVCYLLGIRSPDELRGHPLRGAIFETWVAAELVKTHQHRGAVPALFFLRDRKREEVDLVLDRGLDRLAIETKSAQTVAEDFFAGLEALERIAPAGRRWLKMVVYGGQQRQERSRATVLPWAELDAFGWMEARAAGA